MRANILRTSPQAFKALKVHGDIPEYLNIPTEKPRPRGISELKFRVRLTFKS